MHVHTRLPVVARWRGQEISVDLADTQPNPDIGSIVHLTVEIVGQLQRRPFKVVGRHWRGEDGREPGLLARLGFDGGAIPSCIVLDVDEEIANK
jgi:hypothetical protein